MTLFICFHPYSYAQSSKSGGITMVADYISQSEIRGAVPISYEAYFVRHLTGKLANLSCLFCSVTARTV